MLMGNLVHFHGYLFEDRVLLGIKYSPLYSFYSESTCHVGPIPIFLFIICDFDKQAKSKYSISETFL